MYDIRFYDLNFNLLHIESRYLSFSYTEKLCDTGSFEIHLTRGNTADTLPLPCAVYFGGFCGILTGRRLSSDTALFGKTADFLLSKRICPVCTFESGSVTDIMQSLTASHLSDFAEFIPCGDAKISLPFEISSPTPLSRVFQKLCAGGGFFLEFDLSAKKYVLRNIICRDNPAVFSADRGNASDIVITENITSYATCGLWNGTFITSADAEGAYRWEAVLEGEDESGAVASLTEKKPVRTVCAGINGMTYRRDYFLGDIFRNNAGDAIKLTEISADFDENGSVFTPKFEVCN